MAWVRLRRFSSFWLYPAASLLLLRLGFSSESIRPSPPALLWLILVGCVLWTLVEYGLHRFVFHWTPANPSLDAWVSQLHRAHHAHPRDPDRILARPWKTLPVSLAFLAALYAATGNPNTALGVMMGIWAGFLYYEWIHYRVHTSRSELGLRRHRSRHFRHHFVDPGTGFGVTSGVWDRVFGTSPRDHRKRNESSIVSNVSR